MDAGAVAPPEWASCGDVDYAGGTILACGYRVLLQASAEEVWPVIQGIGGQAGYYFGNYLWKLRGYVDRLLGGIGFRAGRRHPQELHTGDALDFWRVLQKVPPHHLLLLAEMKLPGEAVLEFRLTSLGNGVTELTQLARFLPRGLAGLIYWYALYPFHQWIYGGMLKAMAHRVKKPILSGPGQVAPKPPTRPKP